MKIELRRVSKRFGKNQALREVDLSVASGTKLALLGPNGSGKTTLTRAVMGLIRCQGEILIDGRPLAGRMAVAQRLAYVPQIAPLMAASVGEVVAAVAALRKLDRARVGEVALDLGLDLGPIGRRPLRNLSGGMRQKLLLALALSTDAELLILDEPTASLDVAARARFHDRFTTAAARATVILCSHRLDELRTMVDQVVVLDEGRVSHDGPARDYLDQRLVAVVELRYQGEETGWLTEHGFTPTLAGWWTRAVTPADKLQLIPAALAALGDGVLDLVVRDSERVDLEEASRAA